MIANYGAIDDGGVDVLRIATDGGRIVWRTHVPGLGVSHSGVFSVGPRGARAGRHELFVISQGAGGWLPWSACRSPPASRRAQRYPTSSGRGLRDL